jgi:hypothetical protein
MVIMIVYQLPRSQYLLAEVFAACSTNRKVEPYETKVISVPSFIVSTTQSGF